MRKNQEAGGIVNVRAHTPYKEFAHYVKPENQLTPKQAEEYDRTGKLPVGFDPPPITMEYVKFTDDIPTCFDPSCESDASVYITSGDEKKPWCTGHAHVEISCWMVGL